jgi:hypothetical protein
MIGRERLWELLNYDPDTGVFTWRAKTSNSSRVRVGSVAGCVNALGYRVIHIGGRLQYAHRLAWLYMTGEWPSGEMDHINCARGDNRILNLRLATRSQNICNTRRHARNASGLKGVHWQPRSRRWRAQITVGGRQRHLGYFDNPIDAHEAYVAAAEKHFGQFARAA